ncbi:MAG TPA: protein kinase [Haliangium sp.]|nr:protein kinase [Haliangium sp.]
MIGEVLGGYRITGQIAVGGMGVVYKGEHQIIGKHAAIKLLRREFSSNHQVVDRFFNEARATTIIRHPGIVDIYDFGWHGDGRAFYVMEYIEGETLKQRMQARGILPLENAMRIVRSVAGAVGAAHAHGIIHRDLKPDNIFLVPDPEMPGGERVKVLDFGLAKLSEDQGASLDTQAGIVLGTPTYMAPEQCDGNGNIDHRADQYALGCILYELLCGRPPFASDSPMELFKAHRFQKPAPPRSLVPLIPAEVEHVILKLLAKSRDHRFPDMDRVRIALDNSLTPEADMDTLTEEVPGSDRAPPPAAPPHESGPASSLSGSSGQVMGARMSTPMSTPAHLGMNVPMGMPLPHQHQHQQGRPQSGPMPQLAGMQQGMPLQHQHQHQHQQGRPQSGPMPQLGAMPQHPRQPTGSLVARPVRLPSIPGSMRRMSSLFWALAGLASIFIGFGIVYMVTSMGDEPAVLLPHQDAASANPTPAARPGPEGTGGNPAGGPPNPNDSGPPAVPENLAGPAPDAQPAGTAAPGASEDDAIEMEPDHETGSGASPAPASGTQPAGTPATGTPPAGNPDQPRPPVPAPAPALVDVTLELQPPGAKVTVDGQVRSERPLRLAPRARPYGLVVTAPGFQPKALSVRVDRAKTVRVQLEHERQGIDL